MKRTAFLTLALCLLLTACAGEKSGEPSAPRQEEIQPLAEVPEAQKERIVHTDWSQLGERNASLQPVGTRWYEDYTDHLIPGSDYGTLIPYAGLRLMDDWPAESGCMYGLMTQDGKVVTDPVYSNISRPGYFNLSGQWRLLPLMILKRGNADADTDEWNPMGCAVAALDGSWCTPFDYRAYSSSSEGLLLFQTDTLTVMAPSGEIQRVWTIAETGISQEVFESILSDIAWGEGWGGQRRGDYMVLEWEPESDYTHICCFHLASGEITSFSYEEWEQLTGTVEWQEDAEPVIPNAERVRDSFLGNTVPGLLVLREYSESGITITYYREDGTPLPQLTRYGDRWDQRVSVVGGFIEVLDQNVAAYYDFDTLECRFRTYLSYEGD